jgi:2-polyprenyl-3-methyl-5-hydroxy-6-metoxy-1,4-benzoquinol methylase
MSPNSSSNVGADSRENWLFQPLAIFSVVAISVLLMALLFLVRFRRVFLMGAFRLNKMLTNSNAFLSSIHTLYRMDRGDRIYVKRHFERWLEVEKILRSIERPSGDLKVLDVGCGSGFFMLLFGGSIVGLDNAENVEVCKRRGLQVYSTDLEKDRFPLEIETFDSVICLEVLEHLADPTNVLNEAYRLLKSGGYLVMSTPNCHMPTWRIRDFLFGFSFVSRIYMDRKLGKDEIRYGKKELEALLETHGFKVKGFRYPKILLPSDDLLVVARKCC